MTEPSRSELEHWLANQIRWRLDPDDPVALAAPRRAEVPAPVPAPVPEEEPGPPADSGVIDSSVIDGLPSISDLTNVGAEGSGLTTSLRRFLGKALFPTLAQASEFNRQVTNALFELRHQAIELRRQTDELRQQTIELRQQTHELAVLSHELAGRVPPAPPPSPIIPDADQGDPVRRSRLREFAAAFKEAGGPVLDLGCGSGDLLELLRSAGVECEGVDRDPVVADMFRLRGIPVHTQDVASYVAMLEPGATGGMFLGHLIEHFDAGGLAHLLKLCREKLEPGGMLILESTNPRSVAAMLSFWRDYTRVRPYEAETVGALLDQLGYVEVDVRVPEASEPDPSVPDRRLDALLDGLSASRSYAIVARAPRP